MRRRFELNIENPDKYQLIVGESPNQYYIRTSCLGMNYLAHFLEDFEFSFQRKARILEYGDGISTVWWARNFPENEIYSIGGDQWWFNWVEELLAKEPFHHVIHLFHEQTNYYTTVNINNMEYAYCLEKFNPPFDLIINDGGMREIIGDYILRNADRFISEGGIYLRHDYEMAILGNWIGFREQPLPDWVRDEKDLGYEGFCHTHPNYSMVTTTGNGLAGYVVEFGGVWRRIDHQWKRKTEAGKGVEAKW